MRILNQNWKNEEDDKETYVAVVLYLGDYKSENKTLSSAIGGFIVDNLDKLKDEDGERIQVQTITVSVNEM